MKNKILLLTDWFAPGYMAGGPIRSTVNFANAMAEHANIYVLTSDRDLEATASYPNIETDQWLTFAENIEVYYTSPGKINGPLLRDQILALEPTHIYLNSMFSWSFTILPLLTLKRMSSSAKIVLAPRGMLKTSALQYKVLKKLLFLRLAKALGLFKEVHFHATDAEEVMAIQKWFGPQVTTSEIPNLPKVVDPILPKVLSKPLKLLFLGRIHPIKGLDLLLKALKSIKHPCALTIIGNLEDKGYWEQCQTLIADLNDNIQVNFIGPMPHDKLDPVFEKQHFFILPTQGENFGHAIFEAIANGLPVIISDQTPWKGLQEKNIGWDIPLSEPAQFVKAIQQAIEMDHADYETMSKAAWQFAKKYTEDSSLVEQYRALFDIDGA